MAFAAWVYIPRNPWLEHLKCAFLQGILQPGFPATQSATGCGNFQAVALNRAVSSHAGQVSLALGRAPGTVSLRLDRMASRAVVDEGNHSAVMSEPARGGVVILRKWRGKSRSNAP